MAMGRLGRLAAGKWRLSLVAIAEGRVVGTQNVEARNFAEVREAGDSADCL
jgi:hypothetical protein